tara:strand:+ start:981 stop:1187 length:207 start_codon:yes stop_codon:yes gene_type:complete
MLIALYPTKKACKEATGTTFKYQETSVFGPEYKPTGTLTVAHRPYYTGVGREWFGQITLKDGIITNVK